MIKKKKKDLLIDKNTPYHALFGASMGALFLFLSFQTPNNLFFAQVIFFMGFVLSFLINMLFHLIFFGSFSLKSINAKIDIFLMVLGYILLFYILFFFGSIHI